MQDEQFERLMTALTVKNNRGALGDNLQKIGIALCTAGILWVAGQITTLDKTLAVVVQSQADMKANVDRLNQFTSEPRFSEKDFDMKMAPVIQRIEMQGTAIDNVRGDVKDMRNEMRALGADVGAIKRKVQ